MVIIIILNIIRSGDCLLLQVLALAVAKHHYQNYFQYRASVIEGTQLAIYFLLLQCLELKAPGVSLQQWF